MDGESTELRSKLDRLLEEAAAISVALSRADGTVNGDQQQPSRGGSRESDQPYRQHSLAPTEIRRGPNANSREKRGVEH
jgi:hypothetical protein